MIKLESKIINTFLSLFFVLMLTGCGGGGGGAAPAPADITAPVITLNGTDPIILVQGDSYVEEGATAIDNIDGSVSVAISGTVDTSTVGSYTITYTATDSASNTGTATRTVDVLAPDTTNPVITLNGANPYILEQGGAYVEPGATATDDRDGSVSVSISGTVNTSTVGSYTITYTATDSASNTGTTTRTVNVLAPDTTNPVITLNGANPYILGQGNSYVEPGATATDDRDGSVSVSVSGTVDTSTVGSYIITYTATDSASNTGAATRTVDVVPARPFITTWKTDNFSEATATNQIKIGTSGSGYNYSVDWGDGLTDSNVTTSITHTYAAIGTYTVSISGDFPRIYTYYPGFDNQKLLSVEQWGTNKWQSMSRAFVNCSNLVVNAIDTPDLSQVTDMSEMFYNASAFNQDISTWDVSAVTNMSFMFDSADAFVQDLSLWDVSAVTNMQQMFAYAGNVQGLGVWDVSAVTDMRGMFINAYTFNQNISAWNVSAVTNMSSMFTGASAFDQNISSWNVSSVTDMNGMFYGATIFNQDISTWDVSAVTDMSEMFSATGAFNKDISNWNVSAVTDMGYMFRSTTVFNQPLNSWDVSAVTNISGMFSYAKAFNQPLNSWDVSSVYIMFCTFCSTDVFNQDISAWDVSAVIRMSEMFAYASAFDQNLGAWNVSAVTGMSQMFNNITLSTLNYDALLAGWSAQSLKSGVNFDAGLSKYSSSSQPARDVLTGTFGWTVYDGGVAP